MAKGEQAQDINEFEVIVFRCVAPKNGRFGYNGYLRTRVPVGAETEIPRWHPIRDPERQVQLVDEHGTLRWRENKVPHWGELIGYEDRTPRRPSQQAAPAGGKTSKTQPKMRAADTPVGA
jgi:hypothetical protein